MSQLPAERMSFSGHIVGPGGFTGSLTLSISPREIGDLMLRFPDVRTSQDLLKKFYEEGKLLPAAEGGIVKAYSEPLAGYNLDLNHCLDVKNQLQDDINSVLRKIQRASAPPVSAYPQQTASPTGYPAYHQPYNAAAQSGRYGASMPSYATRPQPPQRPPAAPQQRPPVSAQGSGRPAAAGRPAMPPQTRPAAPQQPTRPTWHASGQSLASNGKSAMARFNARLDRMNTWLNTEPAPKSKPMPVHTFQSQPFMLNGTPVQTRMKVNEGVVREYLNAVGATYSGAGFMQYLEKSGKLNMEIAGNGSNNWSHFSGGIQWNAVTIPPHLEGLLFDMANRRA